MKIEYDDFDNISVIFDKEEVSRYTVIAKRSDITVEELLSSVVRESVIKSNEIVAERMFESMMIGTPLPNTKGLL